MNMKKLRFSNFPVGRRAIIFLGLLVILSSFASATVHYCSNFTTDVSSDFTCTGSNTVAWSSNFGGVLNFTMVTASGGCYWNMSPKITNNFTIVINESANLPDAKVIPHAICDGDTAVGTYCAGVNGNGYAIGYNSEVSPNKFYSYMGDNIYGDAFIDNVFYNWTIFVNVTGDHAELYINNTYQFATTAPGTGTLNDFKWFGWYNLHGNAGNAVVSSFCIADTIDECYTCLEPPSLDTTPPTISNLNCTSCNIPDGDNVSPYETEDTTPTFKFDTDENAWCAIGVTDVNYATMGSSRNCTDVGEGTQSHICTLTVDDKFDNVGENYLYISCKDSIGNEGNATDPSKSNSGTIVMQIKGASETPGDDAIDIGIEASEIWPCTVYSEQQISARNLADSQFAGTFDRVAIKDSKRYAFNYVSAGESEITGLFNLTPVLYVLQLTNQTNETITRQVGEFINSTYP